MSNAPLSDGEVAAVDVAALVAYQSGSIVSRQLLKRSKGNVTLFAFDAGQQLSEHTSPFEALVQVIDGEAEISVGGVAHAVRAGQMITLPANVPHGVVAPGPMKMLLTMIRE